MRVPHTINVQCRQNLGGKLKEDIMKEVLLQLGGVDSIRAIQIGYEVIRLTFLSPGRRWKVFIFLAFGAPF